MVQYVILGTSHEIWSEPAFERPVLDATRKHSIRLFAEEHPCDNASRVSHMAKRLHIPYLQIDLFPDEWPQHGIDREMKLQKDWLDRKDVRLSHADAVRESFWLEQIEAGLDRGCVLVICGYLHVNFLARRVEERGGAMLERGTFPPELLDRMPEMVLDPAGLEGYVKKARAESAYSESESPLGHTDRTETR